MRNFLRKIVSVTELRRNFGEITANLAKIDSLILTRGGQPFAILKATPKEKGLQEKVSKNHNYSMKKYFLDTSVIVNFLRGKEKSIKDVETLEGKLTASFICLAELYEGIYRVKKKEKVEKEVLV